MGLGQRHDERREDGPRLVGAIGVVVVDVKQDLDGLLEPQVFREGDDVEVVADDVALDDEVGLDPERLGGGRSDDDGVVAEVDLTGLEWTGPTHLAEPRLDPAESAHDRERRLRRPDRRRPPLGGFHGIEHRRVAVDQIRQDVIVVERVAVAGVERCGGVADEHGVGDDLLQAGCRDEHCSERRRGVRHTIIIIDNCAGMAAPRSPIQRYGWQEGRRFDRTNSEFGVSRTGS